MQRLDRLTVAAFLLLSTGAHSAASPSPEPLPSPSSPPLSPILSPPSAAYIGVGIRVSEKPRGLRIQNVLPWGPAWHGGLRIGDVLLEVNGEDVPTRPADQAPEEFSKLIRSLSLDQPARFRVSRDGSKKTLTVTPTLRRYNYGDFKLPADTFNPRPNLMERISQAVTDHYKISDDFAELKKSIADLTDRGDAFRVPEIAHVMRRPFTNADTAERITSRMREGPAAFLDEAARLLPSASQSRAGAGRAPMPARPRKLNGGITPSQHLSQMERVLSDAREHWERAVSRLTPEERAFVGTQARAFLKKTESMDLPYLEETHERLEANLKLVEIASRVDYHELLSASRTLIVLTEPVYLSALRADLVRARLDLKQAVVLQAETPLGQIVIAGTGDDQHRATPDQKIALLLDLGGDDFYANQVGASRVDLPLAVTIDLDGNDAYESNLDFAQGTGVLGVGILADLAGDDRYIGQLGAQGASLMGVGLLIDHAGRDEYRAEQLAQGASLWGAAAHFDFAGDDRYHSTLLSQGVGVSGGIGALIDRTGDDSYYAKGHFPSDYGTPGTFNGLSQGVGFGMRGVASGGIGLLWDGAGRDHLDGGDFSQGGGHYFGWGILINDGLSNDTYVGSRYNQGFSAHYALATFIEQGGNDHYRTHFAVTTGLAMDIASTWFEDRGGDDHYPATDFSLGSSAHNAITVWIDHGGRDRYTGPAQWASPQGNFYHGGSSLSLVWDLGGNRGDPNARTSARDDYIFTFNTDARLSDFADPSFLKRLAVPLKKVVRHDPGAK